MRIKYRGINKMRDVSKWFNNGMKMNDNAKDFIFSIEVVKTDTYRQDDGIIGTAYYFCLSASSGREASKYYATKEEAIYAMNEFIKEIGF
jgi:hypothetical protein